MRPIRLFAAALAAALLFGAVSGQAGRLEWRHDRWAIDFNAMADSALLYPVLGFDARSVGPIRQPGLTNANDLSDLELDDFAHYDFDRFFYMDLFDFRDLPVDIGPIYPPDSPFRRPVLYLPDVPYLRDPVIAAVPEPSAALAFALGALLVGGFVRGRAQ